MKIGSLSENLESEKRVAITPEIAKKFIADGFEVHLQKLMPFQELKRKVISRTNVCTAS